METAVKESKEEKKIEKFFKSRANIWMAVSIVLVVALVATVLWPSGIPQNKAETVILDYLNAQTGGGVTAKAISDKGNLYEVTITYQNQDYPFYITKDGKYVAQNAVEVAALTANPAVADTAGAQAQPKEVPKSDKPVVEAFVFSYCPYGLQFEKALIPVYNLLKNKADINVVFIGAMHGDYERVESLRQLCISKNYGKDKLFAYLDLFSTNTEIGNCAGSDACLAPLLSKLFTQLSIDKTKIDTCMTADASTLYDADGATAAGLGIGGSPTFVINGAEASVDRTAESIKAAVCSAFTTQPAECSQTLSSTAATAGFGGGTGAATGASCG